MSKKFEQQLAELGITLTQTQFNQFDKYYEMLVEWNKVMNLTGITEYEEVNEKHFVDSLALVKALDISKVQTVIDIGTRRLDSLESFKICLSAPENHVA